MITACLLLSGCSSSSGPNGLVAGLPSQEKTGSVSPHAGPMPSAEVGTVAAVQQVRPIQRTLAMPQPAGQAQSFLPLQSEAGTALPTLQEIALAVPDNPTGADRTHSPSQIFGHQFRDAMPINFGKRSPRKLAVHGVDVSRWQGEIDWPKLRSQGANFVFIKATDGGDHLDPMFRTNWKRADAAGLKRGAYHFFYWCRTAGEQADWFIRNVPRVKGALPPVIDVEWNGESKCRKRPSPVVVIEKMKVFMDKLEAHYGQRPIIYTAPDFYADNLKGQFLDYPFWLRSVAAHPEVRYPGRKWVFWQYSGSGLSHGVSEKIDLNAFHGSEEQWHRWVASNVH